VNRSKFLETIRVVDAKAQNLEYHQRRMYDALGSDIYRLDMLIEAPSCGVYRCRVIYDNESISIEYHPYKKRHIESLKIVESNSILYDKKYLDREAIEALFAKRGESDDILIVKNSLITDTSIANVAFFDSKRWLTPKTPLLAGTTRQRLLDEGKIFEADIYLDDLKRYTKMALMNAMIDFDIIAKEKIEDIVC